MTTTIDTTVLAAIADVQRLQTHPRAHPHVTALRCGGGAAQPGWAACHRLGAWRIDRPWDAQFRHEYCSEHGWARIQADDRMYRGGNA